MASFGTNLRGMLDTPRRAVEKAYLQDPRDRELAAIRRRLDAVRQYQQQSDERGAAPDANAMQVEILSRTAVEAQKEADALLLEWFTNRKACGRSRQERDRQPGGYCRRHRVQSAQLTPGTSPA